MNTSEVLNAAADLIERDGWCQQRFHDTLGGWCASGACLKVSGAWDGEIEDDDTIFDASDEALDVLEKRLQSYVPTWNDASGRTAEEVIQALRDAANSA